MKQQSKPWNINTKTRNKIMVQYKSTLAWSWER